MLAVEGRRRRGYTSSSEEMAAIEGKPYDEVKAMWAAERTALRAKPFIPSQTPFSGGPSE
jgi:hypothetical protein